MASVLNLTYVLEFIAYGFNQSSFAKQDFIWKEHQGVFHVLSKFCNKVYAVNEKLFKKGLRNISFVSEELSIDFSQEIAARKRMPVINVTRSEYKIKNLSFIVDDKMQFKSKKPANAALTLGGKSF